MRCLFAKNANLHAYIAFCMILCCVVFIKVILVLLRITIVYSFPLDKFLHFKSLFCFYFCHNTTFAFVYYCIVCILYQHICWIILFCVIIIFYPLFIVSLSMILFVTIVLKTYTARIILGLLLKMSFSLLKNVQALVCCLCGPSIAGSVKATRELAQ